MNRARCSAVCVSLAVLVGCLEGAGPAGDVSGQWRAPQGSFAITLGLVQSGAAVTGTGASPAFSSPTSPTFTVTGSYDRPTISLKFVRDTTVLAEFTGTVVSQDRMVGVETFINGADTLTFIRQP